MKKKIIFVLLISLVALSIAFSCSSFAITRQLTPPTNARRLEPGEFAEEPRQISKLSKPELDFKPLGDPVDDPTPHGRKH
ncbi:MAG: hypothetical protein JSV58_07160 [Candidatus Bathyarchaeota archaeon]|nr:MAG: hypothetical protein JSV58_07160 [Candidatus Bathyarchaeota archaeon]